MLCGPRIAALPLPSYVVKVGLECKLMLMFCVGIVHTNLYNCIKPIAHNNLHWPTKFSNICLFHYIHYNVSCNLK